ncbi:MAG: hypothetical protein Q8Q09_00675 [Deltaproteobacteria bacterium]|nr:hypothetical protein [Deltaproteobacteria bacterium]
MMLYLVDRETARRLDSPSVVVDILCADRPNEQRLFSLDRIDRDLFTVMERAGLAEPVIDLRSETAREVRGDGNQIVRVLGEDVVTFVRDWLVPLDVRALRRTIGKAPVVNESGEVIPKPWQDELLRTLATLSAWLETAWRSGDVMLLVRPA